MSDMECYVQVNNIRHLIILVFLVKMACWSNSDIKEQVGLWSAAMVSARCSASFEGSQQRIGWALLYEYVTHSGSATLSLSKRFKISESKGKASGQIGMSCNTCWIRSFSSAAPDLYFLTYSWISHSDPVKRQVLSGFSGGRNPLCQDTMLYSRLYIMVYNMIYGIPWYMVSWYISYVIKHGIYHNSLHATSYLNCLIHS